MVGLSRNYAAWLVSGFQGMVGMNQYEGKSMKTNVIVLSCVLAAGMFAFCQNSDEGYQMARVVSFEKIAIDARHPENSGGYKISMRLGNMICVCHASGPASFFVDWSEGKEFPAQLSGKVLVVKNPNGQIAELTVVGKKMPK